MLRSFVRRFGATATADPGELALLQERLTGSSQRLSVSVGFRKTLLIPNVVIDESRVKEWVANERERLMAPLRESTRSRPTEGVKVFDLQRGGGITYGEFQRLAEKEKSGIPLTPQEEEAYIPAKEQLTKTVSKMTEGLGAVLNSYPENRTAEEYENEVEEYLDNIGKTLPLTGISEVLGDSKAVLHFEITNQTERNYPRVELEALMEGPVFAFHPHDVPEVPLPSAPALYGSRQSRLASLIDFPSLAAPRFATPTLDLPMDAGGIEIDNTSSVRLRFPAVDLRPYESYEFESVLLTARGWPEGETLKATWKATSTGADGVCEGSLVLPIADSMTTLPNLSKVTD